MGALVSLFGNPNEKNEQLKAFEFGYRDTLSDKLSLDSTIFYNRYQDSLSQEPGALRLEVNPAPTHWVIPTTFGNGLFGETHGIEVFANLKTTRIWTISPGYGFVSMHLHKYASSQATESATEIDGGTPDHQAQLRSSLSLPRNFQWNASAYFVNRLPAQSIPSYVRFDTGLTWRAGERASISLIGQNLLKAQHPETSGPQSSVLPGLMQRAAYAKIAWSF
jgi:iron complex outermembrane receptor protein